MSCGFVILIYSKTFLETVHTKKNRCTTANLKIYNCKFTSPRPTPLSNVDFCKKKSEPPNTGGHLKVDTFWTMI